MSGASLDATWLQGRVDGVASHIPCGRQEIPKAPENTFGSIVYVRQGIPLGCGGKSDQCWGVGCLQTKAQPRRDRQQHVDTVMRQNTSDENDVQFFARLVHDPRTCAHIRKSKRSAKSDGTLLCPAYKQQALTHLRSPSTGPRHKTGTVSSSPPAGRSRSQPFRTFCASGKNYSARNRKELFYQSRFFDVGNDDLF